VVGEWGGSCDNKDGIVQEHLVDWMIENCFQSNFWWALNPGSADTDGKENGRRTRVLLV